MFIPNVLLLKLAPVISWKYEIKMTVFSEATISKPALLIQELAVADPGGVGCGGYSYI